MNEKFAHTPGPWVNDNGREIVGLNGQIVVLSSVFDIRPIGWEEEIDANTQLAMCAPDLLEALQELMAWQVKNVKDWSNPSYDYAARIVAKATGKTSEAA